LLVQRDTNTAQEVKTPFGLISISFVSFKSYGRSALHFYPHTQTETC
jgi:hypothetical protein